jgi:hypothetical protein
MACPYCTTEPHEPCAQCGRRGVTIAAPQPLPGFTVEDARQQYWDALAVDMRNPCPEDNL